MRTRFRLLPLVIAMLPLSASGEEKIEVRGDGVVLMAHGESHFEDYLDSLKAERLADLERQAADLKKKRPTKGVLLQRKKLNNQIELVKESKAIPPQRLMNLEIGQSGYVEMNGLQKTNDRIRVISVVDEDEFIGVVLYTVTVNRGGQTPATVNFVPETRKSDPLWFRGFSTEKLADNTLVWLKGLYR